MVSTYVKEIFIDRIIVKRSVADSEQENVQKKLIGHDSFGHDSLAALAHPKSGRCQFPELQIIFIWPFSILSITIDINDYLQSITISSSSGTSWQFTVATKKAKNLFLISEASLLAKFAIQN